MSQGIRATVEFDTPDVCPVAGVSAATDTTVDSVAANVCPPGRSSVTEFSVDADLADAEIETGVDLVPVFTHGSTRRYRFDHGDGTDCPCECLGGFGCPVDRYVAHGGTLTLVFHAADYDELRDVVAGLRERFPAVDIKRFVRSPEGERSVDGVFVDRSRLTDRQREILEAAYRMGYFDRPRGASATDVAEAFDIDPSTVGEHLAAAESKLLADLFE
jgi:hypothetical protein